MPQNVVYFVTDKNKNMKDEEIKKELKKLKEQRLEINNQISRIEKECQHIWKHGYLAEPIIYCEICDREIQDVYSNMSNRDIEKLIGK